MPTEADERALIGEVLGGSGSAWRKFFARHAPAVDKLVRSSRSMGSLRRTDDECRNAMSLVFAKLRNNDHHALRTFESWAVENPDKMFADWLTIVVTNVVRDYMRSKLGEPTADGEVNKRLINTLAGELDQAHGIGVRPSFTNQAAAHQLMEFARQHLPADQLGALSVWLEGNDFEKIAQDMQLPSARDAEKLVRAALGRLRRHVQD